MFHIAERGEELDSETSDETILKALVVIHLNEFVEVYAVEVENDTQVVPPYEVVL